MAVRQPTLHRMLFESGRWSRRVAARKILDGRVSVNGKRVRVPHERISQFDAISIDEHPLPRGRSREALWRYHKPPGLITTAKDPAGRPTIFEALAPNLGRVISVGRLDCMSEGLLLLANYGPLCHWLELPTSGFVRTYRVQLATGERAVRGAARCSVESSEKAPVVSRPVPL